MKHGWWVAAGATALTVVVCGGASPAAGIPVSPGVIGRLETGVPTEPDFSPDGTRIVFTSSAALITSDTNGRQDVYVKNLTTGAISRVSTSSAGAQANGGSSEPEFSPDGTRVAFTSSASNLVAGDTNQTSDIFVKDLISGAIVRASVKRSGTQGNSISYRPAWAPDGVQVAFVSQATSLLDGDTNAAADVFVKNLSTGSLIRLSVSDTGRQSNGFSDNPVFSPDGTMLAFDSTASNLVTGDTNGDSDVFVRNIVTRRVARVSTSGSGEQADSFSKNPAFSNDSSRIAFVSFASNLGGIDTNLQDDIYLKTLSTGAIRRISITASGTVGNNHAFNPTFVPGSRLRVAFDSRSTTLTPDSSGNRGEGVFIKDVVSRSLQIVSTNTSGVRIGTSSTDPTFSPDGVRMAWSCRVDAVYRVCLKNLSTGVTTFVGRG